jgi:uncharacterized membrane protein YraQ (UPF0718 family)
MLRNSKILFFAIIGLTIAGCSSTIETSKKTEETVSIEPTEIQVPQLEVKQNLPLTDTIIENEKPVEVYEGTKEVEGKSDDGTVLKADITTTVRISKDNKGKNVVAAETKVTPKEPIKKDREVVTQKTTTDTQKESRGFFEQLQEFFVSVIGMLLIGLIILGILATVFKKYLPFLK